MPNQAPILDSLIGDLRYGARVLRRNPGFTVLAVLTLALGIGANTALFSVVHGVLLQPLPYPQPHELVGLWQTNPSKGHARNVVSIGAYNDWKEQTDGFEAMAAYREGFGVAYTGDGDPLRLVASAVTPGFFRLLGIPAMLGRTFVQEEGRQGEDSVILISHSFWSARLGADDEILGRILTIDGESVRVVGVLRAGFAFLRDDVDIWTPLSFSDAARQDRKSHSIGVIARLAPGESLEQARASMHTIAARLAEAYPEHQKDWGADVVPLQEQIVGDNRLPIMALMSAVSLVLLIGCANIAGLLLARSARRTQEIAVRAALGAGRARLVRQMMTESLLLGLLGGLAGLLTGRWFLELLLFLSPADLPRRGEIGMDTPVLFFTLGLSVSVGLLFGLFPALRASRANLIPSLQGQGSRVAAGGSWARSGLVVGQIALTCVLLAGAGLLVRSLDRILSVDPGFRSENLLTSFLYLPWSRYPEIEQHTEFVERLVAGAGSLPGVVEASVITDAPLGGAPPTRSFTVQGRPVPTGADRVTYPYRAISDGYFRTMGIPVLRGRTFHRSDSADSPPVLMVNEACARAVWPGENPIGRRIGFKGGEGPWYEIVGVVGDTHDFGLNRAVSPTFYAPYAQRTWNWFRWVTVVVRFEGDPSPTGDALKSLIWTMDPDLPVRNVGTMESRLSVSVEEERFQAITLGSFALVAMLLSALGIYGIIAQIVEGRRREIGLRMALGAQRREVLALVLRQGARLTLFGLIIGSAAALGLTRFLEGLLYGVTPNDPVTFAAIVFLLATVALLACWVPARRASRMDPQAALRHE